MISELVAIGVWVGAGLVVAKVVKSGYEPVRRQIDGRLEAEVIVKWDG